ncbi:MAG: CHAP domain-containing protein [Gammaproteobacteria bacterium]|nr:CHAP domain-containing protein [Gammaproteobacteria bacterium]
MIQPTQLLHRCSLGLILMLVALLLISIIEPVHAKHIETHMCKENCHAPFGTPLGQSEKTIGYSNCNGDCVSEVPHHITLSGKKIYTGMQWQCVEYARRWLIENKGVTFADVKQAYQIWDLTDAQLIHTKQSLPWQHFKNKETDVHPRTGDLLIYDQTLEETGHVAVIVGVEHESVLIAEQNYFNLPWEKPQYARRLKLMKTPADHWLVVDVGVIGWMRLKP